MNTVRLVLLTLLASLLFSAPPAHAAEGGVVSGKMDVNTFDSASLCAVSCYSRGESVGKGLTAPDFYPTTKVGYYGAWKTKSSVEVGSYAIFFEGAFSVGGQVVRGYLAHTGGNTYRVVSSFSEGTKFTVSEATNLDLGIMTITASGVNTEVYGDNTVSARGYGGQMTEAYVKFFAKSVPSGSRVIIKSYGCGKFQTKRVVKRSGTFNFTWKDLNAHQHYGATMKLVASVKFRDKSVRKMSVNNYDTSSFGWKC